MTDFGRRIIDKYVDRGDPLTPDWIQTDLITDGNWNDLDLSAIVPAKATFVCIAVLLSDNAVSSSIQLRKKGNSGIRNVSYCLGQAAGVLYAADVLVSCDSDRFIEYKTSNVTFTALYLTIKGWFI